jgi:hypothetical protein
MEAYQVALIHKWLDGINSKPLIVLNVDAADAETAEREARVVAHLHRPPGANAFVLVLGVHPIFGDGLDPHPTPPA